MKMFRLKQRGKVKKNGDLKSDKIFYQRFQQLLEIYYQICYCRYYSYLQRIMNIRSTQSLQEEIHPLGLKHHTKAEGKDDRFIPSRELVGLIAQTYTQKIKENIDKESNYSKALKSALFRKSKPARLFVGNQENNMNASNFLETVLTQNQYNKDVDVGRRVISTTSERILDAPQIQDDYYLNLMDWSSWGQLGICLKNKIYLYTPLKIQQLYEQEENNSLCSISFHHKEKSVAIGTLDGKIKIFDLERNQLVQTLQGHHKRVSSLCFSSVLYSGSKDTMILAHDIRDPRGVVRRFDGHMGEVCGLKNSPSGLASGSNDNMAFIWDLNTGKVRQSLKGHKAAVKALAWCPWQRNLLATGGGTIDKTMKFWNVDTGKCIDSVNTKSQVCSIIWNPSEKQLLSSHGYTDNQLCLWKFPNLTKIQQFHGHTQRVLHMSLAPDESTICSASADETLRFWKIFKTKSSDHDFYKKGYNLGDICNILR